MNIPHLYGGHHSGQVRGKEQFFLKRKSETGEGQDRGNRPHFNARDRNREVEIDIDIDMEIKIEIDLDSENILHLTLVK